MLNDCQVPLERALAWIDQYGDFDGDGFVEYVTRSQQDYTIKDGRILGTIVYPDGSQVDPIASSRGYVYDAWQRAAEIYEVWDQSDRAQSCVPKPTISGSMITLASR